MLKSNDNTPFGVSNASRFAAGSEQLDFRWGCTLPEHGASRRTFDAQSRHELRESLAGDPQLHSGAAAVAAGPHESRTNEACLKGTSGLDQAPTGLRLDASQTRRKRARGHGPSLGTSHREGGKDIL